MKAVGARWRVVFGTPVGTMRVFFGELDMSSAVRATSVTVGPNGKVTGATIDLAPDDVDVETAP